jgi:hypothetical protein
VAAVRFLHVEVLLVALLAAANLSLELGWTGWLSRIRAVGPLMRALRPPDTSSRSGDPRRRTRR